MKNQTKQIRPNIGQYLAKYKLPVFLYILLTLLGSVSSIFIAVTVANAIEQITIPNGIPMAFTLMFVSVGISLFQRLCWYLCNIIYFKYSNKIMSNLNLDLARQAFKLNSKTYNDHETGTFVQRIVDDPIRMVDSMASVVDNLLSIITSVIMLVYITTLNFWISLALVGVVTFALIIELVRVKIKRKNKRENKKFSDKIYSLTTEIVRSEKDIKSLGLENKLSEVSNKSYEAYRKNRYKLDFVDMNFWSARNLIINIGTALAMVLGIYLMDKGLITLATFMIIYSNRGSLWDLICGLGDLSNKFVEMRVCHERMFSLFDECEFITEKFGNKTLENVVGDVEFKNVSYTFREYEYSDKANDDELGKNAKKHKKNGKKHKKLVSENKIFENLSFKIDHNTTVAFVGKSGSGKSTILNLMSKMYEADEGEILIDGTDIKLLSKETLRKTISLVNQFPYIFDMTIKDNLLLAKGDATDDEIVDAITKASLLEFVESLPKGIETKVGESGIKLSGGQKQRLAIARALLRSSNIIIFDESTSSLDNFAQEDIKRSIDGLKGRSTIIIVAHRLSTIKNVDKIFFLDSGKIVDAGTFDELYDRNEKFKAMFLAENI